MKRTCIQTSLESPRTRILVKPFSSAYLNPNIMARYSAALFVLTPKPSRNLQIYTEQMVRDTMGKGNRNTICNKVRFLPNFHHQLASQLQHQLVQDFLSKHHQIR